MARDRKTDPSEEPAEEAAVQQAPETAEQQEPAEHAVPTQDATEIAGSAEDAPLEALQEAAERPASEAAGEPEPFTPIPGTAVPTEEATEIAAVAEDAPLEAAEAEEAAAEEAAAEEAGVEEDEGEAPVAEQPPPREKPAVPGAHLEVDIVPEGADPLGRRGDSDYADQYASVAEAYEVEAEVGESERAADEDSLLEETLAEPISSAAIDLASGVSYRATGKRKTAIARVMLRPGTGAYLVNGRSLEEHFPRATLQRNIRQPLETVGYQEQMDVVARLHGGGISAQAGALRHGVSRALLEADPNLRGELKRRGFLTRDSRAKERKKAGLKKARKRPQFSKR
jgi:small subunit ribosomal protein S9